MANRTIGNAGIDLIVSFENEVLHVYDDGFGYPTLGVGHLLTAAEKKAMPLGTKITKEQSREYFKRDLKKYIDAVNDAVTVPVTQNQFDAMVSLCFNIGIGAFNRASLVRAVNAGHFENAANAFLSWNKAKGQVVRGLTRRRTAERSLFLTPDAKIPTTNAVPANPDIDTHALPEVLSEDGTTEVTRKKEVATDAGIDTVQVTAKNEQDVNETVTQDAAKPYNGIGLKDTLVGDAKTVLPANVGLQSISEYAQQASGWPAWLVAVLGKIAIILVVASLVWILYRLVSYLAHTWKENERVKLQAMINTDISRKNIEIK